MRTTSSGQPTTPRRRDHAVFELPRAIRYRLRELVASALERGIPDAPVIGPDEAEYRVLFVCKGNICRSPSAVGVARARLPDAGIARRVWVDSAGTDVGRPGRGPDPRARREAVRHGISIGDLRARRLEARDLDTFDRIVVFDRHNLEDVLAVAPPDAASKVTMLLSDPPCEIADPVAGGRKQFVEMFGLVERGCAELFDSLRAELGELAVRSSSGS
jgi:protein-tyrosine phosphatase